MPGNGLLDALDVIDAEGGPCTPALGAAGLLSWCVPGKTPIMLVPNWAKMVSKARPKPAP